MQAGRTGKVREDLRMSIHAKTDVLSNGSCEEDVLIGFVP